MVDIVDPSSRSRMMAGIKGRDTTPERTVRSHLHKAGLRFRLQAKGLPGRPDVVLPRWGAVIFVHGCFWHRHAACRKAATPASNKAFWQRKFADNVARDARNVAALRRLGWRVYVVWECGVTSRALDVLVRRIRK
jgi:DNA mismatch endonuclease (patch repair protein)